MSRKLVGLFVLLLCGTASAQIGPVPPTLDHFKFWKVTSVPVQADVRLLGQFDGPRWWSATLRSIEYIGNPTKKTHGATIAKVANPDLHLVAYALTSDQRQRRIVIIRNQFTMRTRGAVTESWTIAEPALLLVPAGKEFAPDAAQRPDKGDHFVCYVVRADRFPQALTLEDQFDVRRQKVEGVTHLQPAFFCVPVRKRHANEPEQALLDENTHLAIYRITPADRLRRRLTVSTADQFGTRMLQALESQMIAVPTVKVAWDQLR